LIDKFYFEVNIANKIMILRWEEKQRNLTMV
jgi:hypothetical protein